MQHMKTSSVEVAVYKGDDLICMGPLVECADKIGCYPETLYWYLMPTYERRLSQRKTSSGNVRRVVRI